MCSIGVTIYNSVSGSDEGCKATDAMLFTVVDAFAAFQCIAPMLRQLYTAVRLQTSDNIGCRHKSKHATTA